MSCRPVPTPVTWYGNRTKSIRYLTQDQNESAALMARFSKAVQSQRRRSEPRSALAALAMSLFKSQRYVPEPVTWQLRWTKPFAPSLSLYTMIPAGHWSGWIQTLILLST